MGKEVVSRMDGPASGNRMNGITCTAWCQTSKSEILSFRNVYTQSYIAIMNSEESYTLCGPYLIIRLKLHVRWLRIHSLDSLKAVAKE